MNRGTDLPDDAPRQSGRNYAVPGLQRGLAILSLLGRGRPVVSVADIARELKIPRATCFRLVWTLARDGYLVRDRNGSEFRLGPKVLTIGFGYLHSQDFIETARPILEQLRDRIGASTHMGVLEGAEVLYLVRAPSRQRLSSNRYVGSRLAAHCSSLGRALLFDHTSEEIAELFEGRSMAAPNENSPCTPAALARAIAEDREKGYVAGRFIDGIMSVAAPVRDSAGRITAAINVSDYEYLECMKAVDDGLKDAVVETAFEISKRLGFQP